MIGIILFALAFVFGFIYSAIFISKYNKIEAELLSKEEAEQITQFEKELTEQRNELIKQLEAVQYQISLLEKLDEFRPSNLEKEEDIKKALAMEKQYNALWTKERKLKQKIKNLRTP